MCIMVLMLIFSRNIAEAKNSKVKSLEIGKIYYYDLNGDKKKEKIECKILPQFDYYVQWRMYINDKLACVGNYVDSGADFCLTDFNTKDKYKELVVHEGIVNQGYNYTVCYRYKGGELQEYFSVTHDNVLGCYGLYEKQQGKGKICFWTETPFYEENLGCYFVKVEYKVFNGKLKKVTGNTYPVIGDWNGDDLSYQLTKNVDVRYGLKDSRTKYTLKRGTEICLKKINISKNRIKYIYIETSTGKKGWIRLPRGKFVKEVHLWN